MKKRLLALSLLALCVPALAQSSGAALFEQNCAVCHEKKGEGIPGFAPRLADNLGERAKHAAARRYFASLAIGGMLGPIVSGGERYNEVMPPFASLTDEDIVAVLAHVLGDLNGVAADQRVTLDDVRQARQQRLSPGEVRRLREQTDH